MARLSLFRLSHLCLEAADAFDPTDWGDVSRIVWVGFWFADGDAGPYPLPGRLLSRLSWSEQVF